jgi:membrane protein required for colicin V production
MGSVNALDMAIAVVVLLSALVAYARGFVHSFLFVAAWVGAIFATFYGFAYVQPYAHDLIKVRWAADIAAGASIFIVTLAILSLISQAIGRAVKDSALNVVDRSLGFLFGILRGVVLVCLAYLVVEWAMPVEENRPAWVRSARSVPLISSGIVLMKSMLPADVAAKGGKGPSLPRPPTEQAQRLLEEEGKKTLDRILSPEPQAQSKTTDARQGYTDQERRDIDRLIDSSQ